MIGLRIILSLREYDPEAAKAIEDKFKAIRDVESQTVMVAANSKDEVQSQLLYSEQNNGVRDTIIPKEFTLQSGISVTYSPLGISGSFGLALSKSEGDGWDWGLYRTVSIGGYTAVVVSAGVELSGSLNKSLEALEGKTEAIGGGFTTGVKGITGEVNIPIESTSKNSLTLTIGPELIVAPYILPLEGHMAVTYTKIIKKEDVKEFFGGLIKNEKLAEFELVK